jgi:phosphoketolase
MPGTEPALGERLMPTTMTVREPLAAKEPLTPEHIKRRLLGHWGSDPGQTLVLAHHSRLIKTLASSSSMPGRA